MQQYISILRGINVGGKKAIKMNLLNDLYVSLGFTNINTYIQSGNVVFSSKKTNEQLLSKKISEAILNTFGFDVPVIVLTTKTLIKIVEENPFSISNKYNPDFLHITFLSNKPIISNTNALATTNEVFHFTEKAIYLYCPNGYSNCKLTNSFIENKLKVTATTRNWKTTLNLLALAA